jgi:hypothetical protein
MARMFAGRKKDSFVWKWFDYNADSDKSVCLAKGTKEDFTCGVQLSGNNSTNLKVNNRVFIPMLRSSTCSNKLL